MSLVETPEKESLKERADFGQRTRKRLLQNLHV